MARKNGSSLLLGPWQWWQIRQELGELTELPYASGLITAYNSSVSPKGKSRRRLPVA